jgi:hypothetical protein
LLPCPALRFKRQLGSFAVVELTALLFFHDAEPMSAREATEAIELRGRYQRGQWRASTIDDELVTARDLAKRLRKATTECAIRNPFHRSN